MKFICIVSAWFLLLAAVGQAATIFRVDPSPVITTHGAPPTGGNPALYGVAGAAVQLCSDAACQTAAVAYTDMTGNNACPVNAPVTQAGSTVCTGLTGSAGQLGFWLGVGLYYYKVTTTSGDIFGPYVITTSLAAGTLAPQTTSSDPGPSWGTLTNVYDSFRVVTNNYPIGAEAGANTAAMVQTFVAGVDIPVTSTKALHAAGLAGYARTASSTTGAVGVYGAGTINADGSGNGISAWGANFAVENCDGTTNCFSNTGHTTVDLYGVEVDMNVVKTPAGGQPSGNVLGIYVVGGSGIQPLGQAKAVDVEQMGLSNGVPWKNAFVSEDGAATVAFYAGKGTKSGATGSQAIQMGFQTPSGTSGSASFGSDQSGTLVITSGISGAGFLIQDGGGGLIFQGNSTNLQAGTAIQLVLPVIKSTTGQRYVCVSTTGQLVSSVTACSGT